MKILIFLICTCLAYSTGNKKIFIISKPSKSSTLDNDKLSEEIHKEVHKHLSIFKSKINNTANHVFQIEENLEESITNKTYKIENNLEEVINN